MLPQNRSENVVPKLLPLPAPDDTMQRFVLIALRRMAAHGIRDAQAASMFIGLFGIEFRRPLVLMRAFVIELARASNRKIVIAPCCTLRMTLDEGRIVGIAATAASNSRCAFQHLSRVTGHRQVGAPLSAAAALNEALADLGRPLAI